MKSVARQRATLAVCLIGTSINGRARVYTMLYTGFTAVYSQSPVYSSEIKTGHRSTSSYSHRLSPPCLRRRLVVSHVLELAKHTHTKREARTIATQGAEKAPLVV